MRLSSLLFSAALASLVFCVASARALEPDEIAILAIKSSPQSRELAEYYARVRGIPAKHICLLDLKPGETIARAEWEVKLRPSIRRWIATNELEKKIRCLVTVWDVPLKIGPLDSNHPTFVETQRHFEGQRKLRQEQLRRLARDIDRVLAPGEPEERPELPATATQKDYAELLDAALKGSQARLKSAQNRRGPELLKAAQQLERLYLEGGGVTATVRSLQGQMENLEQPPLEMVRSFEFRRGELAGLRAGQTAASAARESMERDQQILTMLQQSDGLLGVLAWIEQSQEIWKKNETYSSFDSELALLYFPAYALMRWQSNPLHYAYNPLNREALPWTLMVARIEAPTFEQAKRLIDSAIEVEKTGLSGKVYIDARGINDKTPSVGSYGDYDQSLRDLARLLKEHTSLEVVLDDRPELFQPGDCPDAALYCGWYSLTKYVDAFQWKPGAVGYHLASGEATTLRKAGSEAWCKRMLESGVGATLGPTYEPYLAAFPRPLDFFPLLLTGRYTLAETYARTNPFNSWVMVLVGDPLYNPFRNNPQFDEEKLPEIVTRMLQER